jgi:maltose O-acetyltransferase
MSMRQRMLAGELYLADDPELIAAHERAVALTDAFNRAPGADSAEHRRLLTDLFAAFGADSAIRPPLHVDYGSQIRMGTRCFANFGLVILDVAEVTLGDDVQIGPYVQLLTATHPLEAGPRRDKLESGHPIRIGDNVWLGGGVIVCPGVTIGENAVVGAGSVVTADVPPDVLVVGSPARPVRTLNEH